MLLVLLLLPMCWAVEVKRPRGVSLTSESATGGGQRWGWGVGGSWERHLTAFGLSVLVSGQERWQCSTGGWGERSHWVERASSCPGLSPLPHSPDHHFYDESKPFTCLDGSASVPFDQVNDDYCDCKDGSDEPGELVLHSFIHHAFIEQLVGARSCAVSKTDPVLSSESSLLSGGKRAQKRVVSGLVRRAGGAMGAPRGRGRGFGRVLF